METADKWSHMNMDAIKTKRRLLWHGMLIFVFGLLAGATVLVVAGDETLGSYGPMKVSFPKPKKPKKKKG